MEVTKKCYCEYKYCDNPTRALPPINNDYLWSGKSKRRLHKKCWKEWNGNSDELKKNPKNYELVKIKKKKEKKIIPTPTMKYIECEKGKPFLVNF